MDGQEGKEEVPPPAKDVVSEQQESADAKGKEKKPSRADAKEARKAQRLAAQEAEAKEKAERMASFGSIFGKAPLVQSQTCQTKRFVDLPNLTPADANTQVLLRVRLQQCRKQSKMCFCVFRHGVCTIQGVIAVADGLPKEMLDFASNTPPESVVDVEAVVVAPEKPVLSTTLKMIELKVLKFFVVSAALPVLPFQLEDAAKPATAEGEPTVNFDTRLATRWLELRTPASNAIFKIQSRIGQYFREYLLSQDFIEIHSPKIIATASEGGASVFKVGYFGKDAYLAQSPQLYKQMALQGDLERVFEVAPVFRAENANTHRHLTEFVGLDIEMVIKEHYFEVLDVAEDLFHFMFQKLATHVPELQAINAQYPFSPFQYELADETIERLQLGVIEEQIESKDLYGGRIRSRHTRVLRMPFVAAIALLNTVLEAPHNELEDVNTENEKRLGALVKARYGVDFYIIDRYPCSARPFYSMPCPDDPRFTNSFDMFMRCEEISSGAQRVHDAEFLLQNAAKYGVDLSPIRDYVESFRLGAWPHGGFGVGLERVAMLYLGLKNIRYVSMFPRDPRRVTP